MQRWTPGRRQVGREPAAAQSSTRRCLHLRHAHSSSSSPVKSQPCCHFVVQQWRRQWQGMQGEVDLLHQPPPEAAAAPDVAADAAAEAGPQQSWIGPVVAAWAFLATAQQRLPEQQAGWLADWLAARLLPVGMLRALSSAWSRFAGAPQVRQR